LNKGGDLKKDKFVIALAGNPNAGKTTIFNNLTGSKQHVANYPGVTVEKKEGYFNYNNVDFEVVDLPGTYSLSAFSVEEIIARDFLIKNKPDVVVDIIDASNLERNLYLSIQILELGVPVILVFNMVDEAKKKGIKINIDNLSQSLNNIKIVETVGNKGEGIEILKEEIYKFCLYEKSKFKPPKITYGELINRAIEDLVFLLEKSEEVSRKYNIRWLALKLIEDDKVIKKEIEKYFLKDSELFQKMKEIHDKITMLYDEVPEIIVAEKRYGYISGLCTDSVINTVEFRHDMSDKIDKVLTNKFIGLPIFFILMYLTFQLTFSLGSIPMDWIEGFFNLLVHLIDKVWQGDNILKNLVVQGIIGGVGSVLVFLPNIVLLFFAIGILEFTGYMARAAFILDKIMHKIGLHGKSFIPMLIGFGCNVPGILATRTLNTEKERLITILILPLMSCGARLPVYLLIIPAFFPEKLHAPIMWLIYVIGIVLAIISAIVLNKFSTIGEHAPFIMELPPYRIPTFKAVVLYMWEKSYLYLKKAGTVILSISIILWALSYFPTNIKYSKDYDALIKLEKSKYENFISKIDVAKDDRDRPDWMGSVDFSDLKIKLVASILAISGIGLLETFLKIAGSGDLAVSEVEIKWMVIIHIIFIISGLLLAMMDYVAHRSSKH
jgi:ferrous iron transport protein B